MVAFKSLFSAGIIPFLLLFHCTVIPILDKMSMASLSPCAEFASTSSISTLLPMAFAVKKNAACE